MSVPHPSLSVSSHIRERASDLPCLCVSASSNTSNGRYVATNNLPPLLFHPCHGENIRLLNGGARAQRVDSYCKGIVFSSRPVRVNEKVRVGEG